MRPRFPSSVRYPSLVLAVVLFAYPAAAQAPDPNPATAPRPTAKPASESTPKPTPPRPEVGPILLPPRSADSVAASLRSAGDRYDPNAIDWTSVPAWNQTSFFGIRARGQVFVYVVDCSGSMAGGARLVRAKSELRRSIMRLQFPQRFKVLFYNDEVVNTPGLAPVSADLPHKGKLFNWLEAIQPGGETDPRGALSLAIAMRPDAIFLLSDGDFPEGAAESVARRNRTKVPIHCIDLSGGTAGGQLRQIAADSGGRFVAK